MHCYLDVDVEEKNERKEKIKLQKIGFQKAAMNAH